MINFIISANDHYPVIIRSKHFGINTWEWEYGDNCLKLKIQLKARDESRRSQNVTKVSPLLMKNIIKKKKRQ
jgi:hypothetical protein